MRRILCGATLGLAWGAGLRGRMAMVAGEQSRYTWSGTGVGVLLPATLVGVTLGWAEQARRTGAPQGWRYAALSPLLFAARAGRAPLRAPPSRPWRWRRLSLQP